MKYDHCYITNRKDINKVATNFYQNLYSNRDDTNQSNYRVLRPNLCSSDPESEILHNEVRKAILSQKLEKTPGTDKTANELLKRTLDDLALVLTQIFNIIMLSGQIPEQWETSHIILLYKTRPMEQAGFRKHFSTTDHIHTVKQIIEKYKEYNRHLYIAFIDYTKVFDSISHEATWESLENQGIPIPYLNVIKTIYSNNKTKIQLEGLGETFKIKRGVRQGDSLSPKLSSAILQSIFRKIEWD